MTIREQAIRALKNMGHPPMSTELRTAIIDHLDTHNLLANDHDNHDQENE